MGDKPVCQRGTQQHETFSRCLASVVDVEPALNRCWVNVLCLLGKADQRDWRAYFKTNFASEKNVVV